MKRLFNYLFLFFVLVLVGVVVLSFVLEDKIGRLVLNQVNQQYGTAIEAQRFDLSLLGHFPAVGGELEGVRVAGAFGEPLLEAQTAGFELPYNVLWGGEVTLRELYLENCTLRIAFDERGRANFDILPAASGETTADRLGIQRARLEDVRLLYTHVPLGQRAELLVETGVVSGDFGATDFLLSSEARVRSEGIRLDDTHYLVGKSIDYNTKLAVDTEAGTYRLQDTRVAVEDNAFRVDGTVKRAGAYTEFDVVFDSEEANLGKVLRLLPSPYSNYLKDIEGDGRFTVDGTVNGRLSATQQPAVTIHLDLQEGELGTSLFSADLSDIAFAATYTNGAQRRTRTAKLTLSDFTGRIGEERIELDLAVQNFDNPYFNLSMNGAADIAPLQDLLELPALRGASGVIEVRDLRAKGRYAKLANPARIGDVDIAGILVADGLAVNYNGKKLGLPAGRVLLNGNRTRLDELEIRGEESDLVLRGTVDNLLPVLLADSVDTYAAKLDLDLQVDARKLDLDNLLHLVDVNTAQVAVMATKGTTTAGVNTARRSRYTNLLRGKIDAQVAAFSYNLIEGEDFDGQVTLRENHLLLEGDAAGMGGRYTFGGRLDFAGAPHLRAQVKGIGVDAHRLFAQAENFGQAFIRADNLDGTLNAYTTIDAYWNKRGEFLFDQLHVSAGLGIINGNLKDFALLENFEDYIDGDKLRDVQFRDLKGFFEIRRGEVRICKTQIASNAVDKLYVSGRHDFEQAFGYFIRVDAGEVLAKKLFGGSRADRDKRGLINLHYVVEGDVEKFDYARDKNRVRDNFRTADNVQRRVVKELTRAFPDIRFGRAATPPPTAALPAERQRGTASRRPVPAAETSGEEYIDFELTPGGR